MYKLRIRKYISFHLATAAAAVRQRFRINNLSIFASSDLGVEQNFCSIHQLFCERCSCCHLPRIQLLLQLKYSDMLFCYAWGVQWHVVL